MESSYDYGDGYDYGVDSHYTTDRGGSSSTVHISGGGSSSSSTVHVSGGGGGSSSSSTISVSGGSAGGGSVSVGDGSVSIGGGSSSVGGSSTAGGGSASAGAGGSITTGTDEYTDLDGFKEEELTDYGDLDNYDAYGDLEYDDKVDKTLPAETDEYYGQVKNNGRTYYQKHDLEIKRTGADYVCASVFAV